MEGDQTFKTRVVKIIEKTQAKANLDSNSRKIEFKFGEFVFVVLVRTGLKIVFRESQEHKG